MKKICNVSLAWILFLSFQTRAENFISPLQLDSLEQLSKGISPSVEDCPPEISTQSIVVERGERTQNGVTAFVDLQFLIVGANGEERFQAMPVPSLQMGGLYTAFTGRDGKSREDLMSLSDDDLRSLFTKQSIITSEGIVLNGQALQDTIDNSLLIQRLSKIDDENAMFATLGSEMKSQSYAKKINFLSNLLSYLNYNYDASSLTDGRDSNNPVSDMDLMRAIRESIRTGHPVEAGVCRHMHKLAIKMAVAMGIPNAYTVAYNTYDSSHMNMIIQDPSDPRRVFQLNYGERREVTGVTGPEALTQNQRETEGNGIVLRLYNSQDEHVINLPTEEGAILNRVTGGRDRDLSPDYKSKSQFRQAGIQTPYGTVRVFNATSPLGNNGQINGAAVNTGFSYNDLFYGEYGIAGFMSERPVDEGSMSNKGVYAKAKHGLKVQIYESPEAVVSAFSEIHNRHLMNCSQMNSLSEDCYSNKESDVSIQSGIQSRLQLGGMTMRTGVVVQNQFARNFMIPSFEMVLSTPVIQVSHDADFNIVSSLDGNVGGELTFYNLGPGDHSTYNAHLGLRERKTKSFFQVQADGRLFEHTPIWLPDSEKTISGTMGTTFFSDQLYINLDGRKSMEIDGNYYLGIGIGGSFSTEESK